MAPLQYTFSPNVSFSVFSGVHASDDSVEVRWLVGLHPLLSMDLAPSMVAGLRELPANFGQQQFERAIGERAAARLILRHLLRKGIVVRSHKRPSLFSRDPSPTTRLTTAWPTADGAFRISSERLSVPSGVVSLAYYGAAIDGEWCGFGVSSDPGMAEETARYEAIERLGAMRPELSRPVSLSRQVVSLETAPGLLFDYFRAVASRSSSGDRRDRYRLACGVSRRTPRGLIPVEWIYLRPGGATNTNGMAHGASLDDAIRSAQRELLERDMLLRAWYGLVRSRELSHRELQQPSIAQWRYAAMALGLTARWFVLGEGPSVTVACILNANDAPHLGLGSATRAAIVPAAGKAFLEAAGSHLGHVSTSSAMGSGRFVRDARRRASGDPEAFGRTWFEAHWAASPRDAAACIAARFSRPRIRARASLDSGGFLWVDMTPRGLQRGHVVKVFHPGAVPLPNNMAQVLTLEQLLGVRGDGTPPPIS